MEKPANIISKMPTTNQYFLQATDHFYKTQYQKGLQQLNKCIDLHPHNSTLLANRALFFSQMGHLQKAIQQLQHCISLDYQNYIPYFNMFSLKVRKNQLEEALKELACSLSCLYLTRARFRKRDQDAKEAIRYARNNVEAHVLRAMMFLEGKKLKECINELDWAYELNPHLPTLNKIRAIVQKKLGILGNQTEVKEAISLQTPSHPFIPRLLSTYQPTQPDLMIEIKMKMTQFNSVYNDLNDQNGIVTHRVPRTLLPEQIEKLLTDNDLKQEIQELYELKYNADDVNQPVIYQMKEEYRVQNQIEFEERLRQQQEEEGLDSQGFSENGEGVEEEEEELNNSSLMDRVDHEDQQEISKIAQNSKEHLNSDISKEPSQVSQGQFNEYLVVDQYPQFPAVAQDHSQSLIQPSQSAVTEQKYEYFESSVSSRDHQETISLYPMAKKLYGRFKIERFEIDDSRYISQFFENQAQQNDMLSPNKEMYCVCTYFKQKPGYKVTTCDRGLFFNSDTRRLECEWSETFKEILLTQEPEQLAVKIYAKNTDSYNDDLIGTGSKTVDMSGQVVVSISGADQSKQKLGQLYLRLFPMDK